MSVEYYLDNAKEKKGLNTLFLLKLDSVAY